MLKRLSAMLLIFSLLLVLPAYASTDLPSKQPRVESWKEATVDLFWDTYRVGTVKLKVNFVYNATTQKGLVTSVETLSVSPVNDFNAFRYPLLEGSDFTSVMTQNLEPIDSSDNKVTINKYTCSINSAGVLVIYTTKISY